MRWQVCPPCCQPPPPLADMAHSTRCCSLQAWDSLSNDQRRLCRLLTHINRKDSLLIFKIQLAVLHAVTLCDLMSRSLQIPHVNAFLCLLVWAPSGAAVGSGAHSKPCSARLQGGSPLLLAAVSPSEPTLSYQKRDVPLMKPLWWSLFVITES